MNRKLLALVAPLVLLFVIAIIVSKILSIDGVLIMLASIQFVLIFFWYKEMIRVHTAFCELQDQIKQNREKNVDGNVV